MYTSTRWLMEACVWLSVKQLVVYQSTVMVHKTLLTCKPYYLHSKLNMEYSYRWVYQARLHIQTQG